MCSILDGRLLYSVTPSNSISISLRSARRVARRCFSVLVPDHLSLVVSWYGFLCERTGAGIRHQNEVPCSQIKNRLKTAYMHMAIDSVSFFHCNFIFVKLLFHTTRHSASWDSLPSRHSTVPSSRRIGLPV